MAEGFISRMQYATNTQVGSRLGPQALLLGSPTLVFPALLVQCGWPLFLGATVLGCDCPWEPVILTGLMDNGWPSNCIGP